MKKLLLSLFVIALTCNLAEAAKWRVNNKTGIDTDFPDLPSAVAAATSGDTIYVEASPNYYGGSVTISKPLVIIGSGYFHNYGIPLNNQGLQTDTAGSMFYAGGFVFNTGSAGSVVMGLSLNQCPITVYTSNITIKRTVFYSCYLYLSDYYGTYTGLSNLDIRQNIFFNYGITSSAIGSSFSFPNVNIQNNIFYSAGISLNVGAAGAIQNNMFDNSSINTWGFQVNNNIVVNGTFTANNCVHFNNIGNSTQFPNSGSGSNNQQNITTTALFTNYSSGTETRYTLASAGPGVGTGFNGVNCGAFGGPDPYKLSGIPAVPTIYSLTAPNTTTSNTLPVTISTRSND